MTSLNPLIVKTQMLIRRPVAGVFEAFVDPAIATRFWFTKSSGRLEQAKELRWDWEMYWVSAPVRVKARLERDVVLKLVADRHPESLAEGGS